MYDFQWDVTVDASEFEPPPIPDGYTEDMGNPINEQAAAEGLRQSAELFGKYPESLSYPCPAGVVPGDPRTPESHHGSPIPPRGPMTASLRPLTPSSTAAILLKTPAASRPFEPL